MSSSSTGSSSTDNIKVAPGPRDRTIVDGNGQVIEVPDGWDLLPPGDAGLTRKVKSMGPTWTMVQKRGRKTFSKGMWAPAAQIERAREAIDALRSDPKYQKKREGDKKRRELKQVHYVHDFHTAVCDFLYFDKTWKTVERELADKVTAHATPVGSGTVARTSRIPIERRAEAAVIAWMRHQTTAYDDMEIPREKGLRREVRRMLAERSRKVLNRYRRGDEADPNCPLMAALKLSEDVQKPALTAAEEAEKERVERENERRVAAGLPPSPWPAPPLERPRGGWAHE